MDTPLKITALEVENVKRVKHVQLSINENGLTTFGGRNAQGKTSLLDAIKWTLGGDRYKPSNPNHDGEQAATKITLNNGMTVEVFGKNGSIKVVDSTGKRSGITIVQDLISTFALDLPKFMSATSNDKAKMLLDQFPGLGKKLADLNAEEKKLYDERLLLGRQVELKQKHADDLPYNKEAPEQLLSGSEMSTKLTKAMSVNAGNRKLRDDVPAACQRLEQAEKALVDRQKRIDDIRRMLTDAEAQAREASAARDGFANQLRAATSSAESLVDEDVSTINREMEQIDIINSKVRQNMEKQRAEDEATSYRLDYESKTHRIEAIRDEKVQLLSGIKMPLEGLAIVDGELLYKNQKWDCMSGAEKLQVGTAICASIKPSCGFVLLDELERMDVETMSEFSEWLEARNLQAIGTRVGRGDENSIIIEDGVVAKVNEQALDL